MYDRFLSIFQRNYWKLTEDELYDLGVKNKLLSEKVQDRINYYIDNPGGEPWEDWMSPYRKEIIEGLIEKDKYANSILTLVISLIALTVSFIALLL